MPSDSSTPGGPSSALRVPAILAFAGALLGFAFAASSTLDYAQHLDRQVHDLHCSFIPGADAVRGTDTACRAAMYSPYSAIFRDRYWGGVPISLFAVGAFAFFAAFALYTVLAGRGAPRKAFQFLGVAGTTPAIVSVVMLWISATRLGQYCKTCVGIYISSAVLLVAGVLAIVLDLREASKAPLPRPARAGGVAPTIVDDAPEGPEPRRPGGYLLLPLWLLALGLFSVVPAALYVSALPTYATYINGCGKLDKPVDAQTGALHVTPAGATVPVTMFVDPLCPTCKAFHKRLVAEGYFDQLDTTLVPFPLDSECNWMLDRPVHPGSCQVVKALLCAEPKSLPVLEWAYERQDDILAAAKANPGGARALIKERWPDLDACIDSKETGRRLDKILRYIVSNHLPVSTPQLFIENTRLCDEDTDIGLPYAIKKLAPGLKAAQ